jgi:hypothetical protein
VEVARLAAAMADGAAQRWARLLDMKMNRQERRKAQRRFSVTARPSGTNLPASSDLLSALA